jgi:outer membrane protein assembly factor BamB
MAARFDELRASYDGGYLGASLAKGEISIWKIETQQRLATVRPGFERSAQTYAVDPINRLVFAGTWEHGLTCFDYESGSVVWHRADVMGIQRVDLSSAFPSSIFVAVEAEDHRLDEPGIITGVLEIDTGTGQTVWMTEDWDEMYVHPSSPIILIKERYERKIGIFDGLKRQIGSAAMNNFAILAVAFASDRIAVAEGAKGMRTLGLDGREIAHYCPTGRETNFIRVGFSSDTVHLLDDHKFVTSVDANSGTLINEYKLEPPCDVCFVGGGVRFVDDHGKVRRSSDGHIEATLH